MPRVRVHNLMVSLDGFASGTFVTAEKPFGDASALTEGFDGRFIHGIGGGGGAGAGGPITVDTALTTLWGQGVGVEIMGAERPGLDYSYTNNWPPEPLVDNHPTADIMVWSAMYSCAEPLGGGSPMVGAVPADAGMAPRLTLAYRRSTAPADSVLAAAGTEVTGHEFHRTAVAPGAAGALGSLGPPPTSSSYSSSAAPAPLSPAWTSPAGPEGFAGASLHASYLHTHWAGHPALARRFADQARLFTSRATSSAAR